MTRGRVVLMVVAALVAAVAISGTCLWATQQLVAIALPLVVMVILALSS